MYVLRLEKKSELKSGRTFAYMSRATGLTDRYIKAVFAGEHCRKITALVLISLRHEIAITDPEMEKYLQYYFKTKEE